MSLSTVIKQTFLGQKPRLRVSVTDVYLEGGHNFDVSLDYYNPNGSVYKSLQVNKLVRTSDEVNSYVQEWKTLISEKNNETLSTA